MITCSVCGRRHVGALGRAQAARAGAEQVVFDAAAEFFARGLFRYGLLFPTRSPPAGIAPAGT